MHTLPLCLYGSFFDGEETSGGEGKVNETSFDLDMWTGPSAVIGFTLKGFPIYGPYEDAALNKHSGMDACGGKLADDGTYAYYTQDTYPYMIGCLGPGKAISETTAADWVCTGAPPEL